MDPVMIFSGDGHIGQPYAGYQDYIDPEYRDRLEDLAETQNFFATVIFGGMGKMAPEDARVIDVRGARSIGTGGMPDLFWDIPKRLGELDAEGIAGEFVIADSALAPFFSSLGNAYPPDVRSAGARAFNRWAADLLDQAGGRIVANAEMYPDDIERTVADLPRLAEQGFVSITLPGANADADLPQLWSREYDPMWEACAELGIALNIHAGWGRPQGTAMAFFRQFVPDTVTNMMEPDPDAVPEDFGEMFDAAAKKLDTKNPDSPMALKLHPQQALWRLMLSGVFDRFPTLMLVLSEVRADWVPATLDYLDQRFAERAPECELTPSEYYARNCAVTPSSPHLAEAELVEQIGVRQFLFGADIPHPESTWPNTRQWIGDVFQDLPEDQLRMILGENAARVYKLKRAPMDAAAARLAITPSDLFSGDPLDDRLIGHFHARAGYQHPTDQLDKDVIDRDLEPDFTRLAKV